MRFPKPQKRYVATPREWEKLHALFADECCVACGLASQVLHHIAFKKADGGDDVKENLVPMCVSCHDRFHSRAQNWLLIAAHVRAYVMARESRYRYVTDKLGARFEARYPTPVLEALGDLDRYRSPDAGLRSVEDQRARDADDDAA